MSEIKPLIEFRDDILKLYTSYLDKRDGMTDRERDSFCDYFDYISRPMFVCDSEINLKI